MIGAIIGDIVGSVYEFNNIKSKEFQWFDIGSHPTDDTIMTIAIAKAFLDSKEDYSDLSEKAIYWMRYFGNKYGFDVGYGEMFRNWLTSEEPKPYNSFGNGAAMRISAAGWFGNTLEEVKKLSKAVTEVTHNHIDGLKGAQAVAVCIFLSRQGKSKGEIKKHIESEYYNLNFKIDDIRKEYQFDETCQGSVPQAIRAFLESRNFIDAIQTAISLGGDSDTIAAITGSIAEAYYFFPPIYPKIIEKTLEYLDKEQRQVIIDFDKTSRINRSLLI